jgi:glycosyltransferase involved in cell wall biosynthesis
LEGKVDIIAVAPPGIWANKIRKATFRGPLWAAQLRQLVRSFGPDVIHVQHAIGFGTSCLDLLGRERIPMVVTLPDYWLLCDGIVRECGGNLWRCARRCAGDVRMARFGLLPAAFSVWLRRRQVRRFVKRFRPTLAAISASTRRIFDMEGFPADLLVTRMWGTNDAAIERRCLPKEPWKGPPRIGYLGSVRPHKGCHVLLEAFKRLRQPATLHFHGSGDESYLKSLQSSAEGLPTKFHGRFDHSQVPDLLANLDVVVIPSIWEENYCLVFQEAMAARLPVVASRVGGLRDRVKDGVHALLVPPGDVAALTTRLDDLLLHLDEWRGRFDYQGCRLSIDDDAREWMGIYRNTIERRAAETGRPQPTDTENAT